MDQNEEGSEVTNEDLDQLEAAEGQDEGEEEGQTEGAEGAEGQDEGEEEGGEEARAASRGQNRVQKLANERAKEREARIQAEAEAKQLREQAEFYRQQAERLSSQQRQTPPAEEQYVDPDEKWRRESQAMLQQGLARQADLADKAEYALAAVKHPLKAKYMDRVEVELQKARANGYNPTRDNIYLILLGKDTDANHGKVTPAAAAAKQRVAAAKNKPVAGRSDVAPKRGEKTAADRLDGVIL